MTPLKLLFLQTRAITPLSQQSDESPQRWRHRRCCDGRAEAVRFFIPFHNVLLLHISSDGAVQLTLNNTAHWGDNTLCLLGANWLPRGLLSKAAFAHRTVQQVTDPLKPLHRWIYTTWMFLTLSEFLHRFVAVDMSDPANFARLQCARVKFNMVKRPWRDDHKDSKLPLSW